MALDKHNLQALCGKLADAVSRLSHLKDDDKVRQSIAALAHEILDQTTLPEERWISDTITLATMTTVQIFIKWGCFNAIPIDGSTSYQELAKKANAELGLVRRIGDTLVANKILQHDGLDHISHTPKSLVFANPNPYVALSRMSFEETLRACAFMPAYFDEYKRLEPDGPVGCPFTYANGHPEKNIWEILHKDPDRTRNFMQAMTMSNTVLPGTTAYNFGWVREVMNKETDRLLFIDIGGGKGHVIHAIWNDNKWLPKARCMVQDREEVVKEVEILGNPMLNGVRFIAHDFNLEQPVKGALIYHLRRCLHDYGDAICIKILRHVAEAMAADSRLLIVEQIMAEPPSLFDSSFDIVMMTIGGKERSARQFQMLLEEAGLKVLKIYSPDSPISVIECAKV